MMFEKNKYAASKVISLSKVKKYHSIPSTQIAKSQKEALIGEIKITEIITLNLASRWALTQKSIEKNFNEE